VKHSPGRRRAAQAAGFGIAALAALVGCVPPTSAGDTTGTTDAFAALATFVGDFLRQILAAFLF
jgi:hypothetical protein